MTWSVPLGPVSVARPCLVKPAPDIWSIGALVTKSNGLVPGLSGQWAVGSGSCNGKALTTDQSPVRMSSIHQNLSANLPQTRLFAAAQPWTRQCRLKPCYTRPIQQRPTQNRLFICSPLFSLFRFVSYQPLCPVDSFTQALRNCRILTALCPRKYPIARQGKPTRHHVSTTRLESAAEAVADFQGHWQHGHGEGHNGRSIDTPMVHGVKEIIRREACVAGGYW